MLAGCVLVVESGRMDEMLLGASVFSQKGWLVFCCCAGRCFFRAACTRLTCNHSVWSQPHQKRLPPRNGIGYLVLFRQFKIFQAGFFCFGNITQTLVGIGHKFVRAIRQYIHLAGHRKFMRFGGFVQQVFPGALFVCVIQKRLPGILATRSVA